MDNNIIKIEEIKRELTATKIMMVVDELEMLHSKTNDINVIFSQYFWESTNFNNDPYCLAIIERVKELTNFIKVKDNEYRIVWNYDV